MRSKRAQRLAEFQRQFQPSDAVLVVISADPDAIASAMAVARLLRRRAGRVVIANLNQISRPDNLAMIRLLRVRLTPFAEIRREEFQKIVLVDAQPPHHEILASLPADVIIDHHPDTSARAPFTDIRPQYGATATILTEYLRAAGISPARRLATALYHAIKTDTDDFKRQTSVEDLQAFQYLFRRANIQLARRIAQADLRLEYLRYFKIALQGMRRRKNRIFAHLGPVSNPDVCVILADFFMRIHTVSWSIVSGICERRLVVIFRNDGVRGSAGLLAQACFGSLGSAGGHATMARAEIPLAEIRDPALDPKDPRRTLHWIIARIERRSRPRTLPGRPASETAPDSVHA
ncbi:MAG: DHH family phosphoesterase [Desulfobacterales bacterium]